MLTTYLNIGFYIHNNKGIQSPPNTEQQNAKKYKLFFTIHLNNYFARSGRNGRSSRVMVCKYAGKYKERIPQSENQSYSISIMAIHTISEDIALKTVTINIFLSGIPIQQHQLVSYVY